MKQKRSGMRYSSDPKGSSPFPDYKGTMKGAVSASHLADLSQRLTRAATRDAGREVEDAAEIDEETKPAPMRCQPVRQAPSIFPIYLPLGAQHRLFVHVQNMLEQACYEYGSRKLPDLMHSRGWDCPEAGELNLWAGEFSRRLSSFDKRPSVGVPLRELFLSIANIRHTAVHRVRVHAKAVEKFLNDAERLMVLLEHTEYREKISKLRRDAGAAFGELGRNKHLLRARLDDTLQNISEQRKKLDVFEQTAIDEMAREDREYQLLAEKCVEAAIAPSEASFSTAFDALKDGGTTYDDTDSTHEYFQDGKLQESGEVNGDTG